ncbi:hypothetical protein PTMSG1_09693 [Pyrenophora teres f. maculata]|nr:hypothetical protein PTMSG1_09693 [Pyrenophora teres f. maculata]
MTAPVNSYLKALLALSEDKTLESSRRSLLQSLSDADLQRVVQHGVGREFARGALEDIAITILDVIVRDPQANYDDDATKDGSVKVKKEPGDDRDNIVVLAPPERRVTRVKGSAVKKTQAQDGKKTRVTDAKKMRTTDVRKTRATARKMQGPDVKKTQDPDVIETLDPDVKETQDPDVEEIQDPDVKKARVPFVIKTEPEEPIKTQLESSVETQLDSQLDLQLESQPDPHVDSQPDVQSDLQPDPQVDSQFDSQTNLQPDLQLDLQPDPQVDLQQDPQLNSQLDPQLDSQLDPQLSSQSHLRLDSRLDPQLNTQPDPQLDSQSVLHLDPQLESQPDLQLDSQLDPLFHSSWNPPLDRPQFFQPHMFDPELLRRPSRKRDGTRCSSVSLDLESVRKRAKNSPAPLAGAQPRVLRAPKRPAPTTTTTADNTTSSPPYKRLYKTQPLVPKPPHFKLPHILVPINCNEVNQTIAAELVDLVHTDTILQEIKSTHSITPEPAALELLAAIPTIIWFPKESLDNRTVQNVTGRPAPPTELPTSFHAAICAAFTEHYLSTDERRERYRQMLANQDAIMMTESCVNNYVVLRSETPSPRSMSRQDQEGACDECIKKKRVCARFVRVGGKTQLAVFPLPIAYRAKKQWMDLACWIQE